LEKKPTVLYFILYPIDTDMELDLLDAKPKHHDITFSEEEKAELAMLAKRRELTVLYY
jgi:hypothetical protein